MCVCNTLLQLKIPCVWLLGLNHWMKAGVKPNNMVIPILTVHCLNQAAMALKHQEYGHTFYRVTLNMCIIYRMGNDCLCWVFLVTVDIIRDWLPQVPPELPFCVGIELGRCIAPSTVFLQPYVKKRTFGALLYGSKNKHLFRMNLMHGNTDNISHVPILTWPGMKSSITSHGSVNDITEHLSLNYFLVLSFDTKMSHLKRRRKVLRANQCCAKLTFISINVSFTKTVSLKTFPWIFAHPNLIKDTITFDVSSVVNVRFEHCELLSASHISSFTSISGSTISPTSVAKLFWWV